jgi:hypothetical protein
VFVENDDLEECDECGECPRFICDECGSCQKCCTCEEEENE